MTNFTKACIDANREIYLAIKDGIAPKFFKKGDIGVGGDISSALDLFAESIFVKYLSSFGRIESEESGIIGEGQSHIIIDPIDGSSNALSLFPYYGTSIAKLNSDGILDSAIVTNLANGDIFIKELNKELYIGKIFQDNFKRANIVSNNEIGIFEKSYNYPKLSSLLIDEGLKFRTPGAIALSLAYARSVSYVVFIGEFRIYDFAAGLALCEGLEVIVEADYVIVSKDKSIAKKIKC